MIQRSFLYLLWVRFVDLDALVHHFHSQELNTVTVWDHSSTEILIIRK